jgi:hypothetical protein
MTFTADQTYYEEHRSRASEYCRELNLRMINLRRQLKNCERAFTASANIKKICEMEIIPIKTIPTGVGKKEIERQTKALIERIKSDDGLTRAIRELLRKEGHSV